MKCQSFLYAMALTVGLCVPHSSLYAMGTLGALGTSVLKSEFVQKHVRDFGIIIGGAVVVLAYKSFFNRLDRIESLIEDIESKVNTANSNINQIDETLKWSIQNILEKIQELPRNKDMERMLLELRTILMDEMQQLNNKTSDRLRAFEASIFDRLAQLEKRIEEKLARLEQKIDNYNATIKEYQDAVDEGLTVIGKKQQEVLNSLPVSTTLKQAMRQQK